MIISIINRKGGVGKTSASGAISSILAGALNKKVLCIDLDPQCNLSDLFQADYSFPNVENLFMRDIQPTKAAMQQCIQKTSFLNIDLICGSHTLDIIGTVLALKYCRIDDTKRNFITPAPARLLLAEFIELIYDDYDFIILDNTPFFNIISENSLSIANAVLIPVQAEGYSYTGLSDLLKRVYDMKGTINPSLNILGVFFCNVKPNTSIVKEYYALFKNSFDSVMLDTMIRNDTKVIESNGLYTPLYAYKKKTGAVLDFMKLIAEIGILEPEEQATLEREIRRTSIFLSKK